ncbi:MAG: cofactor-independent phosphoglycerate mutase [Bacteroidaceae bacterium]|nr:cofactor-independent phosphoglycerate mutase [Bacteroidaceae bacterium]
MKHIILLGDGMADWPCEELGGKTLLQYANTPHLDWLARNGKSGLLQTVQKGFHPGSEVANSSILGYDQNLVYEGRGPLEAASIGVELADDDLALRCNLVCLEGDLLKNHSCGRLETEEGDILIRFLQEKLGSDRIHFYTGVQYRHLLVIKGGNKHLRCTPPHDIPLKPWREHMLQAECHEAEKTAQLLTDLILRSQELLAYHPLNIERQERGLDPANCIWPWGGGYRPKMKPLTETYPQIKSGAVITAVDLIRGIGRYAGLDIIHVPGATGLWDTDYRGKANAAIDALRTKDFVYLHVEACDEAGHDGDMQLKLNCIENFDHKLVAPILDEVGKWNEPVAIALLPDHPTPILHRTHTAEPVPFCIYYPGIEPDGVLTFDEVAAKEGAYGLLEGDGFIREFMNI